MDNNNVGGDLMSQDYGISQNSINSSKNPELPLGIIDPKIEVFDFDPIQWVRWYDLIVKPNRAEKGLYILHDEGNVLTVNPKRASADLDIPNVIKNPSLLAKKLYKQWLLGPVLIAERSRWLAWLDNINHSFKPNDDIISLLLKIKDELLNEENEGIIIYPHPFASWRIVPPDIPSKLIKELAPNGTRLSIVLAFYRDSQLWSSVLLGIENGKIVMLTTIPINDNEADIDDWKIDQVRLLDFAEDRFAPVAIGLFCQCELAESLGFGPGSWIHWKQALETGNLTCLPNKEHLVRLFNKIQIDL
jgi:hypothetical protein